MSPGRPEKRVQGPRDPSARSLHHDCASSSTRCPASGGASYVVPISSPVNVPSWPGKVPSALNLRIDAALNSALSTSLLVLGAVAIRFARQTIKWGGPLADAAASQGRLCSPFMRSGCGSAALHDAGSGRLVSCSGSGGNGCADPVPLADCGSG